MKLLLLLLIPATFSTAHFLLKYPEPRGFDETTLDQFPCGGQNSVSSIRTLYPLTGGAISLVMGSVKSDIQVLVAIDSSPTTAFNTVLRHTFTEIGLGKFCMTNINLPDSLDIREGTNATIQVIASGDPDGGLYNCADITFGISAFDYDECHNSTGVTTTAALVKGNANETTKSVTSGSLALSSPISSVQDRVSRIRNIAIIAAIGAMLI